MRAVSITLIAVVAGSALYAYAAPRFRPLDTSLVLGFTASRVTGDLFGLVRACQSEFPDSHVCSPTDLAQTNVVPEGLSDGDWAWIDGTTLQSEGSTLVCSLGLQPGSVTPAGAAVDIGGAFGALACADAYPVACCK